MRRKDEKVELLRNVSLFAGCTNRELQRIATLADEVTISKGSVLTQEGRSGREAFVVVEGVAKCVIGRKKVASYGPGDFFGEMAILDQGPRVATVTAESDMKLLVLDARSFASLLDNIPAVARKILKTMAQRLREAEKAPAH